ncbi:MAG: hypothetical protein AAF658_19465 [Myxococcota bacterium]
MDGRFWRGVAVASVAVFALSCGADETPSIESLGNAQSKLSSPRPSIWVGRVTETKTKTKTFDVGFNFYVHQGPNPPPASEWDMVVGSTGGTVSVGVSANATYEAVIVFDGAAFHVDALDSSLVKTGVLPSCSVSAPSRVIECSLQSDFLHPGFGFDGTGGYNFVSGYKTGATAFYTDSVRYNLEPDGTTWSGPVEGLAQSQTATNEPVSVPIAATQLFGADGEALAFQLSDTTSGSFNDESWSGTTTVEFSPLTITSPFEDPVSAPVSGVNEFT